MDKSKGREDQKASNTILFVVEFQKLMLFIIPILTPKEKDRNKNPNK